MLDLDDPERYLEEAVPAGYFACPVCHRPLAPEEWCIPPYDVMHGTCPAHGPQWGFKPGVPFERRVKIRQLEAPGYRWTVPDLSKI